MSINQTVPVIPVRHWESPKSISELDNLAPDLDVPGIKCSDFVLEVFNALVLQVADISTFKVRLGVGVGRDIWGHNCLLWAKVLMTSGASL